MIEAIHEIIRESVSGGFWKFAGYVIIISLVFIAPLQVIANIIEWIIITRKSKKK